MFSEIEINELRDTIKSCMSDFRYKHTLGVENAAVRLGNILSPDCIQELRVAALLHDITKEMPLSEQISLLEATGFSLSEEDKAAIPALHSFSAVPFIKMHFPLYATSNVLSAVENHTLGNENISLFDKIIFLADFIEDGRTYESCVKTAEFVRNNISTDKTLDDNLKFLDHAVVLAIDFTIASVKAKNQIPHSRTFAMKRKISL